MQMAKSFKMNGFLDVDMEKERIFIQMATFTRAVGFLVKDMVKELSPKKTVTHIQEDGSAISVMVKESRRWRMVRSKKVPGTKTFIRNRLNESTNCRLVIQIIIYS